MQIEVATPNDATTKVKGDLLESVAIELLKIQNFEVASEVRVTASELDLLCHHKVNRRQIYVECKAHRAPLTANILTNLLGTVKFKEYHEGWLISTGPLSKDAKGFQYEWEQKPTVESQSLSIYTPERVLEAFINANLIQQVPNFRAVEILKNEDLLGDWTLLISPYGKHWVATILKGGVPDGALVFSAKTGSLIQEKQLLDRLANVDSSLNNLNFDYIFRIENVLSQAYIPRSVVEVQYGDNWSDYRPARPEDFVGRKDEQDQIIKFLSSVREQKSLTRVFAITGDSGMGKSSLIAKLRSQLQNQRYRSKYFLYAVDVRAATDSSYILSALLSGLNAAAERGFGNPDKSQLKISNPTDPLSSESVQRYLKSLETNQHIVCLVFDQFEELYSKTDLFPVFEVAQNLLITATSLRTNLVLGFAWKTDSTVQQNHPAYYLWHRLADHRMEVRLRRFTHSEASSAITVFEKELDDELRSDLRRQLIENSQGYPWLLKKLSIHVYDQIRDGVSQSEIMSKALDIESLFKRDLQELTRSEDTCLKMIAKTAPADWYEVLEASDQETLRSLQQKRLVVRSGDRINLYWDIFREYVVSGVVPSIPLTYLPNSPSLRTMLALAQTLDHITFQTHLDLGRAVGISEKSAGNIVRDLIMFGIATGEQSQVKLSDDIATSDPKELLKYLRKILRHHALTMNLSRYEGIGFITTENLIEILQDMNPAAQHQHKTWKIYAERMGQWLSATGYLLPVDSGWKLEDRGEESISSTNALIRRYYTRHPQQYRENTLFIGDTSPYRAVQALQWLQSQPILRWSDIEDEGYRNGARTLLNLRLIRNENGRYLVTSSVNNSADGADKIVWMAAKKEPAMETVVEYLQRNPTSTGYQVGNLIAEKYEREWTPASLDRIGNSLRQWGMWLIQGISRGTIPDPPGRKEDSEANSGVQMQLSLLTD